MAVCEQTFLTCGTICVCSKSKYPSNFLVGGVSGNTVRDVRTEICTDDDQFPLMGAKLVLSMPYNVMKDPARISDSKVRSSDA